MSSNKKHTINGLLLVDKPAGMTSHDLVETVKKKIKARKVGHTGTLDPFATGLMILCIGAATRLARFLGKEDKIYKGRISLGFCTDTYDSEGRIRSTSPVPSLNKEKIQKAAKTLTGKIKQIPPSFSAKRVAGTRSYHLARRGEPVPLKPVDVTVHYFKITSYAKNETILFEAKVSTGTYIRSLAYDLGKIIGCGGTLTDLKRTSSGVFNIQQAIKASDIAESTIHELKKKMIPLSRVPLNMQTVRIEKAGEKLFSQGSPVPETYFIDNKRLAKEKEVRVTAKGGDLLGIGIVEEISSERERIITVQPKVVFA